jgi:small subunit ribosomal protein S20
MPNIKSAIKELRKNVKRQKANNLLKKKTNDLVKKTTKAITAKTVEVKKDLPKIMKAIDKMTKKGLIKKNTASRQKSKLQRGLNTLK